MAEFYARSDEQLATFIQNAGPGDIVYLAPGTYDTLTLRNAGDLDITIASLDSENPAVITGLRLSETDGVRFSNLIFEAAEGDNNCFSVSSADDITFSGVVFRGPDNVGSGEEVSPLMIRSSTNITVVDSEFYHVQHGLKLLDVDGLFISGNSFHDIRCDGIRGGGVSNAVITNNTFTDFFPINTGGSGDHPDAIQLWSTNQDEPGRNITISDNLIYRGDGLPIQGVFIRDTRDNMPFEDVTVSGNVILGGLYNGVSVDGVIGGEVTGNLVIGFPDQRSFLRVIMEREFSVVDNFSTSYAFATRDSVLLDDNHRIDSTVEFAREVITAWQASGSTSVSDLAEMLMDAAPIEFGEYANPMNEVSAFAISTFTHLAGTRQGETLNASTGGSEITAGGGDDAVFGSDVHDVLVGNLGDDRIYGRGGDDLLSGNGGDDTLYGNAGNDRLNGGGGDDMLYGGAGDDELFGGDGSDQLEGGDGNDFLYGQGGGDTLFGGAGDDLLVGGVGNDIMIGGVGADRFIFRDAANGTDGIDSILDFNTGEDIIDLRSLDANTTTKGNQAFAFVGTDAFSGTAGELRYDIAANGLTVMGDMDGDGAADFQLFMEGLDTLTPPDFLF